MKVYVEVGRMLSRAMDRVVGALILHAPYSVQIVQKQDDADLVFLHVIGYPETIETIERLRTRNQRYAIIQYCLRTTQRSSTADWLPLWRDAELVWSYYDLPRLCVEDGQRSDQFNFYRSPLGVDSEIFVFNDRQPKRYAIFTSGYIADAECASEAAEVTRRLGLEHFHLGPNLLIGDHITYKLDISDGELAQSYQRSYFVAGLRRGEGFELPAIEGLFCGARPIAFDAPHYRDWMNEFAEFIPEGSYDEVIASLTDVLNRGPRPVTVEERACAVDRFSWKRIVDNLWKCVGAHVNA